jgi:homoserine acetyltransferase
MTTISIRGVSLFVKVIGYGYPLALMHGGPGADLYTIMDRLGEIKASTPVMAGRKDYIYPFEHQEELAAEIPDARSVFIDRAGHNPQDERHAEVIQAIKCSMAEVNPGRA